MTWAWVWRAEKKFDFLQRGNLGILFNVCVCVLALSSLQFGPIANFAVTPKRDSPLAPICVDQLFKFRAIQFVSPYFSGPNCCNYHLAFWLRIAALMRRLGRHWMHWTHWTTEARTPSHMQQNLKSHAHKGRRCACVCVSVSALPFPLRHWEKLWGGKIRRREQKGK